MVIIPAKTPERLSGEPSACEDPAQWQARRGEVGVCSGGRRHPAGERPVRGRRHPTAEQLGAQRAVLHRDCGAGWVRSFFLTSKNLLKLILTKS